MNTIIDSLLITTLIFSTIMLIRNQLTYKYSMYWLTKIYYYRIYCIIHNHTPLISQEDIIDYNTYFYDWSKWFKNQMLSKEHRDVLNSYNIPNKEE